MGRIIPYIMENKTCSKPPTNNKFNIEHLRKSCKITFHDNNWRSLTSLSGWWFQPLWMIIPNIWKHNPNVPNHQQNISLTTIDHHYPPTRFPLLKMFFLDQESASILLRSPIFHSFWINRFGGFPNWGYPQIIHFIFGFSMK